MVGRGIFAAAIGVVLWSSSIAAGGGRAIPPRPVGFLATQGQVWVDSQVAPSGTALFPGDIITTGKAAIAEVNLHSGATATLSEDAELRLSQDSASSDMLLTRGTLAVRNPGLPATHVSVSGATVVVEGEPGFPAICRIAFSGRAASIMADRGRVGIRNRGTSRLLLPGKLVSGSSRRYRPRWP